MTLAVVYSPLSILGAPPHPCGLRARSACRGEEVLSSRPIWERGQCWHYAQPPVPRPPPLTETLAVAQRGKWRSCHRVACRPEAGHF
jgi:hypothetical protein